MEECTHSKPSKFSAFKSRFQAHGAILRSLSPFFVRATRLDSGDTNAGRSLLAISGSCVCSSSTSAVIDAQVPACHRLVVEYIGQAKPGSPHGDSKSRYNASKSSAQKEIPKKSRFSNSFNKDYARVSDVSSTSCHTGDTFFSPKSCNKVVNSSNQMVLNSSRQHLEDGHGEPSKVVDSSKRMVDYSGRRMQDDHGKPDKVVNSSKRMVVDSGKHIEDDHGKAPDFQSFFMKANSKKMDDSRGCGRSSESSPSTVGEQGQLCKMKRLNFARGYLPVVEYTRDPCKAFYESMLEMVTVSCVDVCDDDLEDMFAYYLVLNSSHHHAHIKEAFTILLTYLYKSKLHSEGFDSSIAKVLH